MAAGFRGVKLLPANRGFRLSDEACRPFFERAAELGAPMIIHYGVSVDPNADLRMADPLDLSPVAARLPEITFVIAHFGAGYLGNVLKLAYQYPNICVDSSGTNNWMDFMPYPMTLAQVFETCVTALGPERVLFGTDSNTMGPYREWIAFQQRRTLEEIGLSERDRDLILRGNAVRIFGLDGAWLATRAPRERTPHERSIRWRLRLRRSTGTSAWQGRHPSSRSSFASTA